MRSQPLSVVLLGQCEPADEPQIEAALRCLPSDRRIERVPERLDSWPARAALADLCIVLQSWPDEFPLTLVHALVESCLAGRLICCQGAWCGSAGRTRGVWPNAVCVPVEQFAGRVQQELKALAGDRAPLPLTAARDEVFAAAYLPQEFDRAVRVTIASPDAAYARELRAALTSSTDAERTALLLDVDPLDPFAARHQIQSRRAQAGVPIIAIAGFPRAEQRADLLAAGATSVVARLSPLAELQAAINGALQQDRT